MYWDLVPAPNSTATESDVNISWCREIGLLCADALETKACMGNRVGKNAICGAGWCFNYLNWNDNSVPLSEWCKLIGWEKSRPSQERGSFPSMCRDVWDSPFSLDSVSAVSLQSHILIFSTPVSLPALAIKNERKHWWDSYNEAWILSFPHLSYLHLISLCLM